MAIPMGLGRLGNNKASIKRKFRWTATIAPYCQSSGTIGPGFCKTAKRPSWEVEEKQLDYLNGRTWIAGKHSWQEIEISYIDAGVTEIANLISWVGQLSNINNSTNFQMGTSFTDYAADVTMSLYDGCGNIMETWVIHNAWPKSVDFGDLDYSSSDEATITINLRYDSVDYTGICPPVTVTPCCSGCQTF